MPRNIKQAEPRFIFIGHRRSPLAIKMGVTWESGKLAAKQLFDALKACNRFSTQHRYCNAAIQNIHSIKEAIQQGYIPVAMGQKAMNWLDHLHINYMNIIHPAARGFIRKKSRYAIHVNAALSLWPYYKQTKH